MSTAAECLSLFGLAGVGLWSPPFCVSVIQFAIADLVMLEGSLTVARIAAFHAVHCLAHRDLVYLLVCHCLLPIPHRSVLMIACYCC